MNVNKHLNEIQANENPAIMRAFRVLYLFLCAGYLDRINTERYFLESFVTATLLLCYVYFRSFDLVSVVIFSRSQKFHAANNRWPKDKFSCSKMSKFLREITQNVFIIFWGIFSLWFIWLLCIMQKRIRQIIDFLLHKNNGEYFVFNLKRQCNSCINCIIYCRGRVCAF